MNSITVRYTRTAVHIHGLDELTPTSGDGMTYARSACPAITSRGHAMQPLMDHRTEPVGGGRVRVHSTPITYVSAADALTAAQRFAASVEIKVCAHCRAAATR